MDFPWNKPSSDKGLSRWLWKLPDIDGPWLPSQQVTVYVKSFRWISQQFPSFFNIQSYPISPLCSLGFPSVATELATLRSGRGRQPGQRSRGAAQSEARFLNRGKSRLVCPEGYNMLQRCSKHYPWTSKTCAEREISESTRKLSEKTQYFLQHLLSCSTTGHPQRCSLGKPGSVHNCRYYCAIWTGSISTIRTYYNQQG